jgi:nucleoside 2-deoxyribosyltransferase
MKLYLASPFFTPAQIKTVAMLESMLRELSGHHYIEFYSPRQDGIVLKDLPPHERAVKAREVYETNIARVEWCDVVLAVIDDRDAGTYFEVGYGVAKAKRIVTYTANNYGLNVMLQEAVIAHVHSVVDLAYILQRGLADEVCARFRNFHPMVT